MKKGTKNRHSEEDPIEASWQVAEKMEVALMSELANPEPLIGRDGEILNSPP